MRKRIAQLQVTVVLGAFVALAAFNRAASQELAAAEQPASEDAAAIDEDFLEPLGMERSRFNDDRREIMNERVVGYEANDDGYRISHPWNFEKVGSGGVYSSIEDLTAWDRNYYTEEVGGSGFTEQLLERGMLNDGSTIPYAFGLTHGDYRGLSTVAHGGALAGFRSMLLRFPERRTTVLVLCNFSSSDPDSRARRVADIVLADHLEPETEVAAESQEFEEATDVFDPETEAERDDSELLGDYYSEELDATYRILELDGEITLEIPPGQRGRLTPAGEDRFRGRSLMIQIDREAAGIQGFTIDASRVRGIYFERLQATE